MFDALSLAAAFYARALLASFSSALAWAFAEGLRLTILSGICAAPATAYFAWLTNFRGSDAMNALWISLQTLLATIGLAVVLAWLAFFLGYAPIQDKMKSDTIAEL